jgi:hypothetical protein
VLCCCSLFLSPVYSRAPPTAHCNAATAAAAELLLLQKLLLLLLH